MRELKFNFTHLAKWQSWGMKLCPCNLKAMFLTIATHWQCILGHALGGVEQSVRQRFCPSGVHHLVGKATTRASKAAWSIKCMDRSEYMDTPRETHGPWLGKGLEVWEVSPRRWNLYLVFNMVRTQVSWLSPGLSARAQRKNKHIQNLKTKPPK